MTASGYKVKVQKLRSASTRNEIGFEEKSRPFPHNVKKERNYMEWNSWSVGL